MGLRDDGMIGISAILTEVETGQDAHSIATADTFDTGTCGKYRTRCFEAHLRRKGGLVQIASCAEHDVSAVETNRLDFNEHLAGTRLGYFALFQAKHIRSTQRVKTDDTRHRILPLSIGDLDYAFTARPFRHMHIGLTGSTQRRIPGTQPLDPNRS